MPLELDLEYAGLMGSLRHWTDEKERLPAHHDDLKYLYKIIRESKSKVVLEFGIGYSTLVIAKAIEKNRFEWDGNFRPYKMEKNLFTVNVVEANNDGRWMAGTIKNIGMRMSTYNIIVTSCPVMVGTFRDMICHYYTKIPNVIPDFIYLDGPDPKDANGNVRGVHFNHPEAMPMAADLLFIEPILLPGTIILVDGRTANARFLQRNFQRKWLYVWNKNEDRSVFILEEEGLRGDIYDNP